MMKSIFNACLFLVMLLPATSMAGLQFKGLMKTFKVMKVEKSYIIVSNGMKKLKFTEKDFDLKRYKKGDKILLSKSYIKY